jgi:hypothetical protein
VQEQVQQVQPSEQVPQPEQQLQQPVPWQLEPRHTTPSLPGVHDKPRLCSPPSSTSHPYKDRSILPAVLPAPPQAA